MGKKLATHFLKDEKQVKQEWLSHLLDDDHVPLDVAYKATCRIQREYHPYAIFKVTCSGNWSATSIWEHTEEYQVPREETVYIDYKGREHKDSGNDFEVRNGRTIDHYRKPMSRTVYDTEKRTITDNVEGTYGSVGPQTFTEHVATCDLPQLLTWAGHFKSNQFAEVDEAYLGGFQVIPETVQRGGAEGQAKNAAIGDLRRVAKRDVPGNRFEDFGLEADITAVERTDAYLAVYHVFYEYEGEQFECYISGGSNASDFLMERKPVDDSVKERLDSLSETASKTGFFSRKTLFLLGAIWLILGSIPLITAGGVGIIVGLLCLVAGGYCGFRYYHMRKINQTAKQLKEQFKADNSFLKQQILDLSQNETIPDDEKTKMIEAWLAQHSQNAAASNDQLLAQQAEASRQTEKITSMLSRGKR